MINFYRIAKRLYRFNYWREAHREIIFMIRAYWHYPSLAKLIRFFEEDDLRRKIIEKNPYPIEQATRAFFYAGSTLPQREQLIENHYNFLQEKLQPEWTYKLGTLNNNYKIWQMRDEDIHLDAEMMVEAGQRKEGLLSIELNLHEDNRTEHVYQMMFWLNKDKNGEDALWIGAMQGPNMENARDVIKNITKRSHRYRTKNLILYMTMAVARGLGVKHIYAVSNEGYYANNHVRRDRKLKTNFGAFWEEVGGLQTDDPRFYEIPLVEPRKTMEEVPTRKRATYRKRYAFQDDVDTQIATSLAKILQA